MSGPRFSLPPGIYSIQTGPSRSPVAVVCPDIQGTGLTTGKVNTTSKSQTWLINGNGVMNAMNGTTNYALTTSPAVANGPVTRNITAYPWIISVNRNNDGSYTGSIMSNDTTTVFWGITTSSKILMQKTKTDWTFVEVVV